MHGLFCFFVLVVLFVWVDVRGGDTGREGRARAEREREGAAQRAQKPTRTTTPLPPTSLPRTFRPYAPSGSPGRCQRRSSDQRMRSLVLSSELCLVRFVFRVCCVLCARGRGVGERHAHTTAWHKAQTAKQQQHNTPVRDEVVEEQHAALGHLGRHDVGLEVDAERRGGVGVVHRDVPGVAFFCCAGRVCVGAEGRIE